MNKFGCPEQECGRKFEKAEQLREHIQKRHNERSEQLMQKVFTTTFMSKERKKDEEIAKIFPRLNVPNRSQSKDKKQLKTVELKLRPSASRQVTLGSKVSEVISNSRIEANLNNSAQPINVQSISGDSALSQHLPKKLVPKNTSLLRLPSLNKRKQDSSMNINNDPYQLKPRSKQDLKEQQLSNAPVLATTLSRKSLRQKSRSKDKDHLHNSNKASLLTQTATDGFNLQKNNQYFTKTTAPILSKTANGSLSLKSLTPNDTLTSRPSKVSNNILKRHNSREKRLASGKSSGGETAATSISNLSMILAQSTVLSQTTKLALSTIIYKSDESLLSQSPELIDQQQWRDDVANPYDPFKYEETTALVINMPIDNFFPPFNCIQYLFLNNLGLKSISLNGLQVLEEFSANHNRLESMQFLDYQGNQNLRKVHLSRNRISELVMLPELEVLNLSLNRLQNLEHTCKQLSKNKQNLKDLDLSFNPIQKLYNYKYEIVLASKGLQTVDGLKITKFDIDLAIQYRGLVKPEQSNMLKFSSKSYYERFGKSKKRQDDEPYFLMAQNMTEEQYQKLEKEYMGIMKKTADVEEGLEIVQNENNILEEELQSIQLKEGTKKDVRKEFDLLQGEMEVLELLNFMQGADEDEIREMIKINLSKLERV